MPKYVSENVNTNQPCPQNFEDLVSFVNHIRAQKARMYVQVSGYGEEVVRQVSELFRTSFFTWDETGPVGMNPFTILYINELGEVSRSGYKDHSKIIIYARRPVSNTVK